MAAPLCPCPFKRRIVDRRNGGTKPTKIDELYKLGELPAPNADGALLLLRTSLKPMAATRRPDQIYGPEMADGFFGSRFQIVRFEFSHAIILGKGGGTKAVHPRFSFNWLGTPWLP
jgi:hypothetical protein